MQLCQAPKRKNLYQNMVQSISVIALIKVSSIQRCCSLIALHTQLSLHRSLMSSSLKLGLEPGLALKMQENDLSFLC